MSHCQPAARWALRHVGAWAATAILACQAAHADEPRPSLPLTTASANGPAQANDSQPSSLTTPADAPVSNRSAIAPPAQGQTSTATAEGKPIASPVAPAPGEKSACFNRQRRRCNLPALLGLTSRPEPPPLGSFVNGFIRRQTELAEADNYVIYEHEWYLGGLKLGPEGRRHLANIVQCLPRTAHRVVIEPSLIRDSIEIDVARNERRRQEIVRYLMENQLADAEQRVVIGYPVAEGLSGREAPRIENQRIQGGTGNLGGGLGGGLGGSGGLSGGLGGGY